MNQIQQNFLNANTFQSKYTSTAQILTPPLVKKIQPDSNLNSQVYIKTDGANQALVNAELATRDINTATALVQSVEEAAALIENKLVDMEALAMQDSGCPCQTMRKAQESIRDISNKFSWDGKNFLEGGGENNQKTTLRNFNVSTGAGKKDDFQISFKSFNPMSAVDSDGSLEPATPNLPDLNRSSGTDTHAYGDAALYSNLNEDAYLHTHTNAMKEQAIIQIGRAIDGIQSERERLGDYLKHLNNLSEIHQSKTVDKNGYVGQKIDAKQAEEVSTYLKNEILKNSVDASLAQFNIKPAAYSRILN
jgi:hypothetical protein